MTSIRTLTNTDPDFYPLVGPLLARREVVADIGGPIWDDDDKTWFVAIQDRHVVGMCAAKETGNGTVRFQSAWVHPDRREKGIYRRLFAARLKAYRGRRIEARCSDASLPAFLANGFVEVRRRGRFTEVRRDA